MSAIEALYIFDEHNTTLFSQIYSGRPLPASSILPFYLSHSTPRPSLVHVPSTNPPLLLFSILQDRLLFLCSTSSETEPLLVIEFLHRVADTLEDFLGSPLLASKIEAQYDVVAQILGEMCDAGVVSNTENNALREVVDAPSWVDSWLGGFGLPASSPALSGRAPTMGMGMGIGQGSSQFPSNSSSGPTSSTGSAVPWRRSNVRHTSNELYVDIVEKLSVVYAPSGRPLSAIANGTIVFTAKISGVPDLNLSLSAPGGPTGIANAMELPSFHPCVRLGVWREKPGELSFIPPDGRFILAGYECNLIPDIFSTTTSFGKIQIPNLLLPAAIETKPSLGPYGEEFEVRLTTIPRVTSSGPYIPNASGALTRNTGTSGRFGSSGPSSSTGPNGAAAASPAIEDVVVTIPLSALVRSVSDLRTSRGEAHHLATEGIIEWRISNKDAMALGGTGATLRCSLVGPADEDNDEAEDAANGLSLKTDTFDYEEAAVGGAYQEVDPPTTTKSSQPATSTKREYISVEVKENRRVQRNAALMPRSASLSFSVRGWLASGIKVEALTVNTKTSKGLGAGVSPYKGVKYHTISRRGVEVRC